MVRSSATGDIAKNLPEYYPIAEGTGNYKLLEPAALQAALDDERIEELRYATNPINEMAQHMVVERGETLTIREGETFYRPTVTVHGTLVINGKLLTTDLVVTPPGNVITEGEVTIDEQIEERVRRLEKIAQLVGLKARDGELFPEFRSRVRAEFAIMTCEGTTEDILHSASSLLDVSKETVTIDRRFAPGEVAITVPTAAIDDSPMTEQQLIDRLERLLAASYSMSTFKSGSFTYITPDDYNAGSHDATLGYDGLDNDGNPKDNGGTYAGVIT